MHHQSSRRTQIDRLKSIIGTRPYTLKEIRKEEQYEILASATTQTITFILSLPPLFPSVGPVLQIKNYSSSSPVSPSSLSSASASSPASLSSATSSPSIVTSPTTPFHPWVNPQGYVLGCEKLKDWSKDFASNTADLGTLVTEVVDELISSMYDKKSSIPPYLKSGQTASGTSLSNSNNTSYANLPVPQPISSPQQQQQQQQSMQNLSVVREEELRDLDGKSDEELTALLNDPVALQEYIENLEQIKHMHNVVKEMRFSNEDTARRNLNWQSELNQLRSDIDKYLIEMKSERNWFDQRVKEYQDLLLKYSPAILVSKLRGLTGESEKISDELSSQFLSASHVGSCDEFLKEFMEARRVYHLRNAKTEQSSKQVLNR